VLPTLDVPGVQGHYKEVSEMTQRRNLTLSQAGKQYGVGPLREFLGTGAELADKLEEWFRAEACDGFMVQTPYVPGGLEDFVRLVIPELQNRGLFRRNYEGPTLRDHLGLVRPPA
jgi:alkanesulfonate monooxygenase SsuD/methylene tetrahydromethanopterin reductase-like flavin-dependent oxidoreductase (luciferase family)